MNNYTRFQKIKNMITESDLLDLVIHTESDPVSGTVVIYFQKAKYTVEPKEHLPTVRKKLGAVRTKLETL